MIHFVLHEAKDTVAVAVVEGIKAGATLTAWIMDDDKQVQVTALQDIPIGHKIALKDMSTGDTVFKYGTDIGRVIAPIKTGEHAHVQDQAVVSQLLMLGTGSQFPWARLMHWPSKQTMYSFRITQ